jgi:hypothetical protein
MRADSMQGRTIGFRSALGQHATTLLSRQLARNWAGFGHPVGRGFYEWPAPRRVEESRLYAPHVGVLAKLLVLVNMRRA